MVRRWQNRLAFTLVELLIVIGIILILAGISVPIARRISSGNRLMSCQERLAQVGQALKQYRLDDGGFPPHYYDAVNGRMIGTGLCALYDMDYLRGQRPLSCPEDVGAAAGTIPRNVLYPADYTEPPSGGGPYVPIRRVGYMRDDPDASAVDPFNTYQYIAGPVVDVGGVLQGPRGALEGDPDFGRQLLTGDAAYQPDDTTVVCWCPRHFSTITKGEREDPPGSGIHVHKGQYIVLFWDGHVEAKDGFLFRSPNLAGAVPEEAWRVLPRQADWDGNGGKLDADGNLLQ